MLHGGAGDDELTAGSNEGSGWQELYGEAGNDTYRIGMADGLVRIGSAAESTSDVVTSDMRWSSPTSRWRRSSSRSTTTPRAGRWIRPRVVALVIRWTKDGHSGEVRHFAEMGRHIERFVFADGSTLTRIDADWMARARPELFAGRSNDRLIGTSGDDVLTSGSTDDHLRGERGDDWLDAGAGDDNVLGGFGADTVHGGAGNDRLSGGLDADVLNGGAGRDTLYGNDGDDVLSAGSNDTGGWQSLAGSGGNDTYRYAKGDGWVRIGKNAESADTGNSDRVVFTDLSLSEVEFSTEAYWVVDIAEDGSYKAIERQGPVIQWSQGEESGRLSIAESAGHIERFEFADGSTLGRIETGLPADAPAREAGRPDVRLVGTAGADVLRMGAGRDRVDGGAGDDELHGGEGDDTYEFTGRAFGHDTVTDTGGTDTVDFSGGVSWDQLWFSRSGDDLVVSLMGTQSGVTVEDWWNGPLLSNVDSGRQVETIMAGDRSLTSGAVSRLVEAMAGMSPPPSGQTSLSAAAAPADGDAAGGVAGVDGVVTEADRASSSAGAGRVH